MNPRMPDLPYGGSYEGFVGRVLVEVGFQPTPGVCWVEHEASCECVHCRTPADHVRLKTEIEIRLLRERISSLEALLRGLGDSR